MKNQSKSKFTLKIVLSYLVLGIMAVVIGFFIFSEIKKYTSTETSEENDTKLLKTSSFLTKLYEAESLSKLVLQTKTKKNFNAYSQKIDSIFLEIDSLKQLTESDYQKKILDSVQVLLKQKVTNNNELRSLKINASTNSIDSVLKGISNVEASIGKITADKLIPNFYELPVKKQSSLRELVDAVYNKNVPKDTNNLANAAKIDSILSVSKSLLTQAKIKDSKTQRSLSQKEIQVNRTDFELSQKLRSILSAFEKEVMVNTYNDNIRKSEALSKSIQLAWLAALLGFCIVGVFTFLITKDYWKVQTYRQNLEKEKKYSESLLKSREQLIATVSHDLRTPLNTITGYSELIESTVPTTKQLDYLKNIKSASHYVESLVNDLLDFSKLEAGKIKIEEIPFSLPNLIEETAENLKEINHHKPIDLIISIDEKLDVPVIGDPFRIRQILTNLISNAYKFTEKGFIKVEALILNDTGDGYKTAIKVLDSGIGIKKEKQQLIFKEFTQAEEGTDKKYGGHGLGLTISKKMAELLRGQLTLKSGPNQGSSFTLTIPLQISKVASLPTERKMLLPKSELSILIIDDDPAMLRLLGEVCHNLDFITRVYSDFGSIQKKLDFNYDVVLTDIQMPVINGFEVLKKLQSGTYEHYKNQPIIAMTGKRNLEYSVYQKAGFAHILQKPFSKKDFLEALKKLFPHGFLDRQKEEKDTLKDTAKPNSDLYSLEVISSFMGDNDEAINEVLHMFLKDTGTNMTLLKNAVDQLKYKAINNTAHKMLPMFRQLKATEPIPILEKLELLPENGLNAKELKTIFTDLQHKITPLLKGLELWMAIGQDHNG